MARRPEMDQSSETTEVTITKVSDSGYSTACSNSQSQRSGSSKSIHSNSGSSNSSGYGGHRPPAANAFPLPPTTNPKDNNQKKAASAMASQPTPQAVVVEEAPQEAADNMETVDSGCSEEASPENQFDQPDPGGTSDRVHQLAVAQTFQVLAKIHTDEPRGLSNNLEVPQPAEELPVKEIFLHDLMTDSCISDEEFCVVVSMSDGKVLYTSPTLNDILGFPKHMWLGRSFIDFIHQKDKVAFANHITSGMATPTTSAAVSKPASKNTFFCSLRKYRGLKSSGFGVKNKETQYLPFQLSLAFKEVKGDGTDVYLAITAKAVKTAYNAPDDMFHTPKFSTRQLSNCVVSHIDPEAVCFLGYLPQDMIGRSVFDFYHPEDTSVIKEMYETVLEGQGTSCRSKPYRFRAQNGEWVVLETEWSSFINPWSRKLEFVIGQHSVLKGPHNPDVFAPPRCADLVFPDEVLSESKRVQEGIKFLLNESFCPSTIGASKQHVSKRCKDLAVFIKALMDEITKPSSDKLEDSVQEEQSFSTMISHERDSVMLGEISPHHEGYSKSSTETPPSYSQLNYKENIARFFESKPKTALESDEITETTKNNSAVESEVDNSGLGSVSGSGSGSGNSSGSNQKTDNSGSNPKTEGSGSINSKLCNGPLTRAILSKHNEDMEKKMLQKHKELRAKEGKESRLKRAVIRLRENHGVKRCGSDSWEADKVPKHPHVDPAVNNQCADVNSCLIRDQPVGRDRNYLLAAGNVALWPSMPLPPPSGCSIAGMIPVYYVPTDNGTTSTRTVVSSPPPLHQSVTINRLDASAYPSTIKPVPLLNAFAMFGAPPMIYPPVMVTSPGPPPMSSTSESFRRPASQATSVKPEPGSALGSVLLSECSKKDKSMDQDEDSPNMSLDESRSKVLSRVMRDSGTGDESSYSSFSSFNKTDESWKNSDPETSAPIWGVRPINKKPPWLENINITPELVFQYQVASKDLDNVLDDDLTVLRTLAQPGLVDEQLEQLYVDLEKAGLSTRLKIDQEMSSSGTSSGEDSNVLQKETRKKKRHYDNGQLEMIFEENMPLPPPPIPSPAS